MYFLPPKLALVNREVSQMQKKYFTSQDARILINTYGLAIFPVHGIDESGQCTCGHSACEHKGKHPATHDGFKSATKDIDKLLEIWAGRKFLNVGVATGEKSGVFVIDIDSAEGEKNLRDAGKLPDTLSVSTGKGRHLFFRWPGEAVITKRGILPGVDVRGDGGYVCGPGSNHASGSRYDWINPLEVIQDAPDFILDMVVKSRIRPAGSIANNNNSLNLNIGRQPARLQLSNTWTLDDVYDHLSYINPDCGYDEWIQVGMALQAEGVSFDVWNDWSARGSKYNAHEMTAHWRSFKPGGGVSYGTVVHMAKQGGWKLQQAAVVPSLPPQPRKDAPAEAYDENTGEIIEEKKAASGRRKLPLLYADDVSPITDTADFIENLLCENQFSVIYGESNCGKTFFMMDLAMHVAIGRKWRDRDVEQGGVVYAALEGGYNTQNRIVAFRKHYGITETIPLAVIPSSLNLLDPEGDIQSLVEAIWEAKERIGNIKMVIIDTLSRALHGGDENSSMDMGQLIINADAIRAITGAHISFVHHCGKDAVKGARGHSSLRAAVDTEIEISRENENAPSKIKVVKQREMETGEELFFSLSAIELGQNQRGKPVTSCVVMPCDAVKEVKQVKMNPIQNFIYDALLDALIEKGVARPMFKNSDPVRSVTYDELREVMEERGFKEIMETDKKTTAEQIKSATQTARLALKKMGKINFNKKYVWLMEGAENGEE